MLYHFPSDPAFYMLKALAHPSERSRWFDTFRLRIDPSYFTPIQRQGFLLPTAS